MIHYSIIQLVIIQLVHYSPVGTPVLARIITDDTARVNEVGIRTITRHKVARMLVLNGRLRGGRGERVRGEGRE